MSEESIRADFGELMAALAEHCSRRRSGTLFIVTADNHAARFVLDQGEIVTCSYSVKQGHDALPLLRDIKECSYRFADDVFSAIGELPMPPTDKCLKYLRGEAARTATQRPPAGKSVAAAVAIVREELTRLIGPVAGIILDNHVKKSGTPEDAAAVGALIDSMAGQIGNEAKARAFVEAVSKRAA